VTPGRAGRLAWALWLLAFGLLAAGVAIAAPALHAASEELAFSLVFGAVGALLFGPVGAFLAARLPRNPIGWLLAGYGLVFLLLLLFPHGRLPSPGWRPVAWAGAAFYTVPALFAAVSPAVTRTYFPTTQPVVQVPGGTVAGRVFGAILWGNVVLLAVALGSLPVRLRRSRGEERQQVKLFVYTVTVALGAVIAGFLVLSGGYLVPLLGAIPVAAATLAVAGAFQPARRRIQDAVDRRFNRRRYDAARTIAAFSTRLRDQVDLDTLTGELLAVVDQTMQPTQASLWLRPSRRAAGTPR
jgi:hypothetical protein